MPASRILCLARTSRCAIVASGTRKARAISRGGQPAERAQRERDLGVGGERRVTAREDQPQAVVGDGGHRPPPPVGGRRRPRRRRRRRRAAAPPGACGHASSSRRSRSMALRRAVVSSQAPGLDGTPATWASARARRRPPPGARPRPGRSHRGRGSAWPAPAPTRGGRCRRAPGSVRSCRRAPGSVPSPRRPPVCLRPRASYISMIGRTSMTPVFASGICDASSSARSRSFTSTT